MKAPTHRDSGILIAIILCIMLIFGCNRQETTSKPAFRILVESDGRFQLYGTRVSQQQFAGYIQNRKKQGLPISIEIDIPCDTPATAGVAAEDFFRSLGATPIRVTHSTKTIRQLADIHRRSMEPRDVIWMRYILLASPGLLLLLLLSLTTFFIRWIRRRLAADSIHFGSEQKRAARRAALRGSGIAACLTLLAILPFVFEINYPKFAASFAAPILCCGSAAVWILIPSDIWWNNSPVLLPLLVSATVNMIIGATLGYIAIWGRHVFESEPSADLSTQLKRTLLSLPFILPLIFCYAYRPIDQHYTVRIFGCGCHFGFNANCLNFMIETIVLVISLVLLIWVVQLQNKRKRTIYLLCGVPALCLLSNYFCRNMWL